MIKSSIAILVLASASMFHQMVVAKKNAGGAAGPDVYYYSYSGEENYTDGITGSAWQPQNFNYGSSNLYVTTGGTATSIGFWGRTAFGQTPADVKVGLYDTSGDLLASATISAVSADGEAWRDATVSVTVSSGTYYWIFCSAQTEDIQYGYDTANDGNSATETYADSMADPMSTLSNESSAGFGVRIYVD